MWPALWVIGDSSRQGKKWPGCGELDILEEANGDGKGRGTAHCDISPKGICNEPWGRTSSVEMENQGWYVLPPPSRFKSRFTPAKHSSRRVWRMVWDRTNLVDWRSEIITWHMHDKQFHHSPALKLEALQCGPPWRRSPCSSFSMWPWADSWSVFPFPHFFSPPQAKKTDHTGNVARHAKRQDTGRIRCHDGGGIRCALLIGVMRVRTHMRDGSWSRWMKISSDIQPYFFWSCFSIPGIYSGILVFRIAIFSHNFMISLYIS